MKADSKSLNESTRYAVEITIRLGFLLLLVAWCLQILLPFSGMVVWAIVLAMAMAPLYNWLNRRLGNKPKWAAALLILTGLAIILIPAWLFLGSIIDGARQLEANLEAGTLAIPPPDQRVAEWPLIGGQLYGFWTEASNDMDDFLIHYEDQIDQAGRKLLAGIKGVGGSVVLLVLSTIIAGLLLATSGTDQAARKFFHKLVGAQGDDFAETTIKTVQNVVKGVIGVAFIQAFLVGIGFLLAGVPYAGAWTLLVLVMAILQLPVLLVIVFVILWLFSTLGTLPAVLWTIYLIIAGASDNVLKPILLGKGASVPMLVIFLGVIGGFLHSGFIGLFTGAIVLSLGYKLFVSWLNSGDGPSESAAPALSDGEGIGAEDR